MVFWWVGLGEGELLAGTFREPRGAVLRWFFGWWLKRAARLFFFGVVSTLGGKMQCWDWFEMFHMFIHICIYVFFSGICI